MIRMLVCDQKEARDSKGCGLTRNCLSLIRRASGFHQHQYARVSHVVVKEEQVGFPFYASTGFVRCWSWPRVSVVTFST